MGSETSLQPENSDARPFDLSQHESLKPLLWPLRVFLRHNQQYHRLAVGVLVFHHDRLLLVQRSSTERGFPNVWEIPGGSVETSDASILHGAARELFEETGLCAKFFRRQIGDGIEFVTGRPPSTRRNWLKFSLEVEVDETRAPSTGKDAEDETGTALGARDAVVTLNPIEHQDYCWATRKQIEAGEINGKPLPFMFEEQRQLFLQAFELRRADADKASL